MIRTVSRSIMYFLAFLTAFLVTLYIAGVEMTLRNISLFLSLNYEPRNELEALALTLVFFLELSPLMAFVELRTLSYEEKAEILAKSMSSHVIVIGCGHLGLRVIEWLRRMGLPFALIVLPEDAQRNEYVHNLMREGKVPVILGDARFEDVLRRANVAKASAVIITVDSDEVNLAIAKKVKELNPSVKVVVRVFDDTLACLAKKGGVADEVISSSYIAVGKYILGAFVNVMERVHIPIAVIVDEGSPLLGKRVREVESAGVKVLAIRREDSWLYPQGAEVLSSGDVVYLIGEPEDFGRLLRTLRS